MLLPSVANNTASLTFMSLERCRLYWVQINRLRQKWSKLEELQGDLLETYLTTQTSSLLLGRKPAVTKLNILKDLHSKVNFGERPPLPSHHINHFCFMNQPCLQIQKAQIVLCVETGKWMFAGITYNIRQQRQWTDFTSMIDQGSVSKPFTWI